MREAAASAGARGEAQVTGPSVRARRRLVWLAGQGEGAAREGGALAISEPPFCVAFLLTESHDACDNVTTLHKFLSWLQRVLHLLSRY